MRAGIVGLFILLYNIYMEERIILASELKPGMQVIGYAGPKRWEDCFAPVRHKTPFIVLSNCACSVKNHNGYGYYWAEGYTFIRWDSDSSGDDIATYSELDDQYIIEIEDLTPFELKRLEDLELEQEFAGFIGAKSIGEWV